MTKNSRYLYNSQINNNKTVHANINLNDIKNNYPYNSQLNSQIDFENC